MQLYYFLTLARRRAETLLLSQPRLTGISLLHTKGVLKNSVYGIIYYMHWTEAAFQMFQSQ